MSDDKMLNTVKKKEATMKPPQAVPEEKPKRVLKPSYPFTPKEGSLLAEGRDLAKAYGISLNQVLTFLLENAVQEWAVPFMQKREKPGEDGDHPANEGVFPK